MSVQNFYTAENMTGEEYNVSDGSLSFAPSEIRIQVQPGGVKEGSFAVSAAAGMAVSGYVFPGSLYMSCERGHFTENPARISWRFDASALQEGESVDGYFRILSNCGEYKLPFHADVAVPAVPGRDVGELRSRSSSVERLYELAESDWHSAVRLFYRREFAMSLDTDRERLLYRGLSQNPGNEQNVGEFLIAVCGIDPVEFSADVKEIRTELLLSRRSPRTEPREYSFRIRRSGRGYTNLEVTLPPGYMHPVSARVEADDFIGDICEFPYTVDPSRLHAGRNFGSIILKSPYQRIRIPVEIDCRQNSDPGIRRRREAQRAIVELMRAYEKLHIHWALEAQPESAGKDRFDTDGWLRRAEECLQRLKYLERGSILSGLYRVQLLLMQSRVHQAVLELETIRRKLAGVERDEVLEMGYSQYRGESNIEYCYRQFLTALAYNDSEGITPRVARLLRERYRRSSSDWRIAWMLLQLSPEYAPGTAARWNFLGQQFRSGCRSPMIYLEAWDMIAADRGFLQLQEDRRSGRYGGDAFERQVLLYAQRKGLLDTKSLETVLQLAQRRRSFSPSLFRILTGSYDQERTQPVRDEILQGICTMLIRGNITDPSCFVWYSRAVERGISVTRLPEYYLRSMPEDYCGAIPDSVIRSAFRSGSLSVAGRSWFYRYIYENRERYPAVYAGCKENIRRFLQGQIAAGRMSQNLAVLYSACLRDAQIRPDNAKEIVRLSYLSQVRTTHMDMRRVVILYALSSRERSYPMEEGNCLLPVYGDDNLILLEDGQQCRYAASIPYTCDRMMQPVGDAGEAGAAGEMSEISDLPFAVEVSGVMKPDFAVNAGNLQYCEMLVRASGTSEKYRLRLKLHLLRYYEDTGEIMKLEQMLRTLDPLEPDREQRREVIGYMHRSGLDSLAAEWMLKAGAEGVPGDTIAAVCIDAWNAVLEKQKDVRKSESGSAGSRNGRAVTGAYRTENIAHMPERIGDLAWESFLQGNRQPALAELLLSEFEGLSAELEQICRPADSAPGIEDPLYTAAQDRIMRQGLFTGEIQRTDRILRQYRLGGTHRILAEAALAQHCHYVFAGWAQTAPDLMKLIGMMDRRAEEVPAICKLAYLKVISERSGLSDKQSEISQAEEATAQRFLESLLKDEICFPFYRKLRIDAGRRDIMRVCARETMIEYHSPAGTRNARGHVVIHCALTQEGRQEPFTAREMKEMYRGFYVSSFYIFFGEQLHYFITDDPEEKNIVESGAVMQDESISLSERDRFSMIDTLSQTVFRGGRREAMEQLQNYKLQEYLVRAMFGGGED